MKLASFLYSLSLGERVVVKRFHAPIDRVRRRVKVNGSRRASWSL